MRGVYLRRSIPLLCMTVRGRRLCVVYPHRWHWLEVWDSVN
jgi:hypothetical protein